MFKRLKRNERVTEKDERKRDVKEKCETPLITLKAPRNSISLSNFVKEACRSRGHFGVINDDTAHMLPGH